MEWLSTHPRFTVKEHVFSFLKDTIVKQFYEPNHVL